MIDLHLVNVNASPDSMPTFGSRFLACIPGIGLNEITNQECTARSEMEGYISLTRPIVG